MSRNNRSDNSEFNRHEPQVITSKDVTTLDVGALLGGTGVLAGEPGAILGGSGTSEERDSRPIVETYQNTLAGGVDTIRWWAHEKILIGGSILSPQDWQHLKAFYKVEGVLSVEAERHDGNKGIDGPYVHLPAPDDGLPKPAEWWAAGLVFMAGYFRGGRGPLYIHSQSGLGRAPAMAYLCMRAVFRMDRTQSLQMIRATLPEYGKAPSHVAYLRSAEDALTLLGQIFEPRE